MAPTWSQSLVFEIVARIIEQTSLNTADFIDRDKLAYFLIRDPAGAPLVRYAAQRGGKPLEWVAGNMIDWFSAEFTKHPDGMNGFEYPLHMERIKIKGSGRGKRIWAYRLKANLYAD